MEFFMASQFPSTQTIKRTNNNAAPVLPKTSPYDEISKLANLTATNALYTAFQDLNEIINNRIIIPHLKNRKGELLGSVPEFITTVNAWGRYRGFAVKSIWSDTHRRHLDQVTLVMSQFVRGDLKDVASTYLHEMIHVKQFNDGKSGKHNYHNRQFSRWMKCSGLQTSKTGKLGGAEIGVGMTHYIIKDGIFDREMDRLITQGFHIPWEIVISKSQGNVPVQPKLKDASKTPFNCPKCHKMRIWGKPSTNVRCQTPACNNELLLSEQS